MPYVEGEITETEEEHEAMSIAEAIGAVDIDLPSAHSSCINSTHAAFKSVGYNITMSCDQKNDILQKLIINMNSPVSGNANSLALLLDLDLNSRGPGNAYSYAHRNFNMNNFCNSMIRLQLFSCTSQEEDSIGQLADNAAFKLISAIRGINFKEIVDMTNELGEIIFVPESRNYSPDQLIAKCPCVNITLGDIHRFQEKCGASAMPGQVVETLEAAHTLYDYIYEFAASFFGDNKIAPTGEVPQEIAA